MHRSFNLFILLLIAISLIACTSSQSTASTATPIATAQLATDTPVPTNAPQTWTTTHTFKGTGNNGGTPSKDTPLFTVGDDWKIIWTCDPHSFGGPINVSVTVNAPDGTWQPAINAICTASHRSGETEEQQGGQVYLNVTSEGAWTIQVQELK